MFRLTYYYTGFRLYGLRIYGLFGYISVIWSMVNHILVLNFSDIWSTSPGQNRGPYIRNPVYHELFPTLMLRWSIVLPTY